MQRHPNTWKMETHHQHIADLGKNLAPLIRNNTFITALFLLLLIVLLIRLCYHTLLFFLHTIVFFFPLLLSTLLSLLVFKMGPYIMEQNRTPEASEESRHFVKSTDINDVVTTLDGAFKRLKNTLGGCVQVLIGNLVIRVAAQIFDRRTIAGSSIGNLIVMIVDSVIGRIDDLFRIDVKSALRTSSNDALEEEAAEEAEAEAAAAASEGRRAGNEEDDDRPTRFFWEQDGSQTNYDAFRDSSIIHLCEEEPGWSEIARQLGIKPAHLLKALLILVAVWGVSGRFLRHRRGPRFFGF